MKKAWYIVFVLLAVLLFASCSSQTEKAPNPEAQTYYAAQRFITKNFVSDADFDFSSRLISADPDDLYSISGNFSHGGLVNRYIVTVQWDAEELTTTVKSCYINGERVY